MRTVAPGVHVVDAEQRFLGLDLGARMTLLELDGGVLVHSPVAVPVETAASVGRPRWVVAPNTFHHLHVGPWVASGIEGWCAPGLVAKRPDVAFAGELTERGSPFGDEVLVVPLTCFSLTNEVVLLHRPSRTLVVTDLLFNLAPTAPWLSRAAMACLCAYPGCSSSLLERVAMHRGRARDDLRGLLALDFDRVILSHGEIVETGGKDALAGAFRWLGI